MSKSSIYINEMSKTDFGELSFCELRAKEVVNSVDGRRLGRIIDIVFSSGSGEISGIIVPYNRKVMFFKSRDVFIPWECVSKIGEDVIIVELNDFCGKPSKKNETLRCSPPQRHEEPPCPPQQASPDRKCPHGQGSAPSGGHKSPPCEPPQEPDCDHRCEKCMLFDCQKRWSEQVKGAPGAGAYVDKNYY